MGLSAELAKRILSIAYSDLPAEAIHWSKIAIRDTVGVALAGANEACSRFVARALGVAGAEGPCTVLGRPLRANPLAAAQINGTAVHAHDFDDNNNAMAGHPSGPLVPPLFALGEVLGASGKDILLAFNAGFETECRIGLGVNNHHTDKGWHPTSTLGVFGAAAASGRLLGLDEERMATALSIAVSLAGGVKANFGSMGKPLHMGQCGRNGLFAALLAQEGFTAAPDAFEHKQGFLNVFNGEGTYDVGRMLEGWADPLDIVTSGAAVKKYPCGAVSHGAVDALFEILKDHPLAPEEVERIEVFINPFRLMLVNNSRPRTDLEGKFSVHYVLARALMHGGVYLEHFENGAVRDPEAQALLRRVRSAPQEDIPDPSYKGARVRVHAADGRTFEKELPMEIGRSLACPLPEEVHREKFARCAARAIPPENAERLGGMLLRLEELDDIRALTAAAGAPS